MIHYIMISMTSHEEARALKHDLSSCDNIGGIGIEIHFQSGDDVPKALEIIAHVLRGQHE